MDNAANASGFSFPGQGQGQAVQVQVAWESWSLREPHFPPASTPGPSEPCPDPRSGEMRKMLTLGETVSL